jgi:formylglycine-generating enzyme
MNTLRQSRLLFGTVAMAMALPMCASPTALTVTVYSEISCEKKPVVGLSTAETNSQLRSKALATTSGACSADGKVGSVVLYPIDRTDGPVAVQIVSRPDGEDPATCTEQNNYRGCIVARRELRFTPNKNVELRVDLRLSCLDRPCDASSTCSRGVCVNAKVECASSPCNEDALPSPPGDAGVDAGSQDAGTDAPAPPVFPTQSCMGLAATCGPMKNEDCCATREVTGGMFLRSYDGVNSMEMSFPAEVSTFYLDRFETTLGRFENFLKGYPGNLPAMGAGKNPNDSTDPGWSGSFQIQLDSIFPDAAAARAAIARERAVFMLPNPGDPNEPVTGVGWFAALAFCIFDGGRLPTEAEWNYAASGGSQQRVFPWSVPSTSVTVSAAHANIKRGAEPGKLFTVGSLSPTGDSRYGQADMTGNAWEWTLGPSGSVPYKVPCKDCTQYPAANGVASLRGASYRETSASAYSSIREQSTAGNLNGSFGFRCARNR